MHGRTHQSLRHHHRESSKNIIGDASIPLNINKSKDKAINKTLALIIKPLHQPLHLSHLLHAKSLRSTGLHLVIASELVRLRALHMVLSVYLLHFCHWTYTTWVNLRSVESVVSRPVAELLELVRRTWELMLSMPAAPQGDQTMEVESASSCLR